MLTDATMISAIAERGIAPVFSTTIRLGQPVEHLTGARIRATALGVYEVRIDGHPVGDGVLAPGWTAYRTRLEVDDIDVTELVADGAVMDVLVGNGWWRGRLGFGGADIDYGSEIGFIGELELTYADGTTELISTTTEWSARSSDVLANSLYDGQTIDARLRQRISPLPVRELPFDRAILTARVTPAVTRHESVHPTRIWTAPSGRTLLDFGQNLVGWIRLRTRGPAGTHITVRHAEVLDDGELGTRPLRNALATDTFVLSGGEDDFEPTLTFHGFRYAEIVGHTRALVHDDVEAVVVHSDMARTGQFSCSSEMVNQLVENSVWSQKGNFLDLPTDCPQRDERLGWTGDIAVYASTAAFQFDVADILHGWLLDLAAETSAAGYVPVIVPNVFDLAGEDSPVAALRAFAGPKAIWGDAAVWVPEALWRAYGDRERLAAHYPAMAAHLVSVEAVVSETGLWDATLQLGDWLDPTAPADNPLAAAADPGVVATACLFRSASFAAEAARTLGLTTDALRWDRLADTTRAAFVEHYVDARGRIRSDAPTVYALAITFGLVDGETRAAAGRRLAELVSANNFRVATGFAGTPYVTWALSETGYVDHAYRLLLQEQMPSWLYPVTMGATTIWERWDSMLPDGSINPGEMTSFNHYAFGAVADWLYQVVAGIRPSEPGYRRVTLQPTPGPGLDWARGSIDTRHGRIECSWKRDDQGIEVTAVVPDGVSAELVMPDGSRRELAAGRHVARHDLQGSQ